MADSSIVAAMIAADDASRALGIELLEHGDNRATTRMVVRAEHLNGYRVAHGGIVFALADTAFAAACNSDRIAVAASAEIVFLAPVDEGDELRATADLRTEYGRNGIYDVTVRRGSEVVAEFRGRSRAPANRETNG